MPAPEGAGAYGSGPERRERIIANAAVEDLEVAFEFRPIPPWPCPAWPGMFSSAHSPGRVQHWRGRPVSGILASLLDLVFAPVCLACAGAIAAGDPKRLICGRCRSRVRPPRPPVCARCGAPLLRTGRVSGPLCGECDRWPAALRAARSACLLEPPADRIVHQLKYRGWHALAEPVADRMAAVALPPDVEEETALAVPVPTTPARRRQRGYNQAELLARAYARRTRRRAKLLLERTTGTATQTALQPAARQANVAGAFRVARGMERHVVGAHLLLVDDVLTTGATAAECTRTLVAAGARTASVITFARALEARRRMRT